MSISEQALDDIPTIILPQQCGSISGRGSASPNSVVIQVAGIQPPHENSRWNRSIRLR